MSRWILAALLLAAAVVVQVTAVNRLPLPWGAAPDLVLLAVTAIALRSSATAGAVAGFASGLAVDAAPPGDHEFGRYAMALCLAGYVVGALREPAESSALRPLGAAAAATVVTGLGFAFVGVVLGDPRITLEAVASDLAVTLLLTAAVAPFVLYPSLWAVRRRTGDDFTGIGDVSWTSRRSRR
ncbi:rod shape-determining protein MreD [Actinorugispora endophytica]|uniref:Rod shape-determining protein MreD n=1 Tax=Actinorugispora endophytica TaxID=1605990 RepID=A0A4R6UTT9_9ACTN|nr:rod shape-determining protein MreD [Actinorugispora endophytica]TDQ46874.1 rod shape-determining protein MreD [Actinorugispora endophytica]